MSQVEYYDQMYADEELAHNQAVLEDHTYEDRLGTLHNGSLALR